MIEYEKVKEASDFIASKIDEMPEVGIVLGSGWSEAVASLEVQATIDYADVPNMRCSTNYMHPGKFVIGKFNGKQVICMQGRIHMYEGYEAFEVAFPIFVMHLLGVKTLIMTNAAGAINADYSVTDFVLIKDHINFTGQNTLRFNIDERLGVPCPDMTFAYTPSLREKVRAAALEEGIELAEGVYIGVFGPSFETPAEIRAFRSWGADLVGMSTVQEVIAAASCGMEVLAVSLITNMAAGMTGESIGLEDITNSMGGVAARLRKLLNAALG